MTAAATVSCGPSAAIAEGWSSPLLDTSAAETRSPAGATPRTRPAPSQREMSATVTRVTGASTPSTRPGPICAIAAATPSIANGRTTVAVESEWIPAGISSRTSLRTWDRSQAPVTALTESTTTVLTLRRTAAGRLNPSSLQTADPSAGSGQKGRPSKARPLSNGGSPGDWRVDLPIAGSTRQSPTFPSFH